MDSNELLKNFKSRLLNSNKNSGIFYNSFLPSALTIDFKLLEKLELLRLNQNDKSPISLKKALESKTFFISFYDIEVTDENLTPKGILSYAKHIKKIIQKSKMQSNEKNINVLYMGLYFVEGCASTNEGDYFRAPLILKKIAIKDMGGSLYKVVIEDELILNNSIFNILALKNKKKWEYQELGELQLSDKELLIEKFILYFNDIGYRLTDPQNFENTFNLEFENAKGYKRDEAGKNFQEKNNKYFNQAFCLNVCSFGIYDIASSTILSAYNILENEDISFLDEIFKETNDILENVDIDYKESDFVNISSLDFTQKNAVIKSLSNSTFIFGPPGTGKSQVIVNLLANIINKNKSAIFVTEKKVASKVVYDKLHDLNNFALMFHNNDSAAIIFEKIKKIYNNVNEYLQIYNNNEIKNDEVSVKLDGYYDKVKKYKELFKKDEGKLYLTFVKYLIKFEEITTEKIKKDKINLFLGVKELLLSKNNLIMDLNLLHKLLNKDSYNESILDALYENSQLPELFYNYIIKNKIKTKINIWNRKKFKQFLGTEQCSQLISVSNEFLSKYSSYEVKTIIDFIKKILNTSRINLELTNNVLIASYCNSFKTNNKNLFDFMADDWYKKINNLSENKVDINKKNIINNYFYNIINKIKLGVYKDEIYGIEKSYKTLFNDLGRKISNTKTNMRISTLFKNYLPLIKLFFPIIIGSPEILSDCKIIPLKRNEFDYAIFDEASQIFTEKCIPILYRAKKYVISGDDKQLAPTSFFKMKNDVLEDIEDDEDVVNQINYEAKEAMKFESLLDFAKGRFKSSMLRYHYRSKNKELIDFSNAKYYENKLIVSKQVKYTKWPIELIEVNGIRENRINIEEANTVLELVKFILSNEKIKNKSIGIITFNSEQQSLILDLLEKESSKNAELYFNLYQKENGEELFVKSIENVQGDERDIIIFSVGFSYDKTNIFKNYFGPLAQVNGEKRLNVAVSRAKEKMYVIKSINSSIINSEKKGVLDFKDFLKYCELLRDPIKHEKEIEMMLKNETKLFNLETDDYNLEFDSEFEVEVYDEINGWLNKERYKLHTQVPASGYKIDLAIYDFLKKQYVLAIECDGLSFHSSVFSKQNDYDRQKYLENRGWKFLRILSTDWWDKNKIAKNRFINNIKSEINMYEGEL
ncbi:hypothetical protein SLITO_v1c06220 [Spiroplasma litorale]|uniref:RAP domain-containing protein n=1 Tax=Spiroplasma litorale TaxID=216942 RepID=A0A0K1W1S1_9MOLU|nr:AAA domain-containing protein [Spiroplasma litorale]AKX34254.1 hypothetical protein SLITO_v1c06220 [Spiroplasma litorale]